MGYNTTVLILNDGPGPTSGPPQVTSKVWATGPVQKPLTPGQQKMLNQAIQAANPSKGVKVALHTHHPNQERNFKDALIGHKVYTYENVDGSPVAGEYGWVTDLEYWDDRMGEVKLRRKRWLLLTDEEITLPDPFPDNDE